MMRRRRRARVFVAVVIICHASVEHFLANDFRRRRCVVVVDDVGAKLQAREREHGAFAFDLLFFGTQIQ